MTVKNKGLILLLSAGIIMIFISGCDRHARYKVLTFFFTGVPPFEEWVKGGEDKKTAGTTEDSKKKRRI